MNALFCCKKDFGARKIIASLILLAFFFNMITPAGAQLLPAPGTMVGLTPGFQPPVLLGLKIHPENPLLFDFIVDQGEIKLSQNQLKSETEKLVKYFLAALTIPDKEVWVNLSPYEKDRIIPDVLGQTTMGKTMLEQDYILKQLASSLTNPDEKLGQEYWAKVKAQTQAQLGSTNIPMNTFNKVWIVPQKAEVLESNGIVIVREKRLKLMMDQDYAIDKNTQGQNENTKAISRISSDIFKSTILPNIEKELNEGKNFAEVRQIYNSVILATWYKRALQESLLGKIYADKSKVAGVENDDKAMKQRIYEQYLAAFKKGVYSLIKEDTDEVTGDAIPRKYFSGGAKIASFAEGQFQIVTAASPLDMQNGLRGKDISDALVQLGTKQEFSTLAAATVAGSTVLKQFTIRHDADYANDFKLGEVLEFQNPDGTVERVSLSFLNKSLSLRYVDLTFDFDSQLLKRGQVGITMTPKLAPGQTIDVKVKNAAGISADDAKGIPLTSKGMQILKMAGQLEFFQLFYNMAERRWGPKTAGGPMIYSIIFPADGDSRDRRYIPFEGQKFTLLGPASLVQNEKELFMNSVFASLGFSPQRIRNEDTAQEFVGYAFISEKGAVGNWFEFVDRLQKSGMIASSAATESIETIGSFLEILNAANLSIKDFELFMAALKKSIAIYGGDFNEANILKAINEVLVNERLEVKKVAIVFKRWQAGVLNRLPNYFNSGALPRLLEAVENEVRNNTGRRGYYLEKGDTMTIPLNQARLTQVMVGSAYVAITYSAGKITFSQGKNSNTFGPNQKVYVGSQRPSSGFEKGFVLSGDSDPTHFVAKLIVTDKGEESLQITDGDTANPSSKGLTILTTERDVTLESELKASVQERTLTLQRSGVSATGIFNKYFKLIINGLVYHAEIQNGKLQFGEEEEFDNPERRPTFRDLKFGTIYTIGNPRSGVDFPIYDDANRIDIRNSRIALEEVQLKVDEAGDNYRFYLMNVRDLNKIDAIWKEVKGSSAINTTQDLDDEIQTERAAVVNIPNTAVQEFKLPDEFGLAGSSVLVPRPILEKLELDSAEALPRIDIYGDQGVFIVNFLSEDGKKLFTIIPPGHLSVRDYIDGRLSQANYEVPFNTLMATNIGLWNDINVRMRAAQALNAELRGINMPVYYNPQQQSFLDQWRIKARSFEERGQAGYYDNQSELREIVPTKFADGGENYFKNLLGNGMYASLGSQLKGYSFILIPKAGTNRAYLIRSDGRMLGESGFQKVPAALQTNLIAIMNNFVTTPLWATIIQKWQQDPKKIQDYYLATAQFESARISYLLSVLYNNPVQLLLEGKTNPLINEFNEFIQTQRQAIANGIRQDIIQARLQEKNNDQGYRWLYDRYIDLNADFIGRSAISSGIRLNWTINQTLLVNKALSSLTDQQKKDFFATRSGLTEEDLVRRAAQEIGESIGKHLDALMDFVQQSVASSGTVSKKEEYGGINFDPTNMNLQIKRDGKGVPLPLPQQNLEQINIEGLFPVIINIMPVTAETLPVFLGQAPKEPGREPDLAGNTAS